MKLITAAHRKQLLANHTVSDPIPVIKIFTPDANGTWLLASIDPEYPDIAFGLCDLGAGFPEVGEVSIPELEALRGPGSLPVERDLYCTLDKPLSHYADIAHERGYVQV